MSRHIDTDALIEFIENRYEITWKDGYEGGIKDACVDILDQINKMPSAEVEEVIRCKDCKYWQDINNGKQRHKMCAELSGDWFCGDAERKDNE